MSEEGTEALAASALHLDIDGVVWQPSLTILPAAQTVTLCHLLVTY